MLDIKLIRENPELVKQRLATRGRGDEARIAEIAALDEQRRKLATESDNLKAERNKVSKEIGAAKSKGQDAGPAMASMKLVGDKIAALDKEIVAVEAQLQNTLLVIPNLPHESVTVGKEAADNPEVRRFGTKPAFAFQPKPHWEIGEKLGMLDFARATKISGSGFILYKGAGARLERALINMLLDLHTRDQHSSG